MSELLKHNVTGGYPNLMGLFRNDTYSVYAKTGTTDYVYGATKKFRMLDLTESQIVPAASGITANSVTNDVLICINN